MDIFQSVALSLLSPMVLAFLLGVVASLIRSDLKIPPEIYTGLTIYLLFAIGLKGGAKLDGVAFADFWKALTAALLLSLAIPVWSFAILRKFGRFDGVNAAALAAHYGWLSGMGIGGATILGTLAASVSYIAAPAAVRGALPAASPAIYLTAALALTFPFNVILGIPTYYAFAAWLIGSAAG